MRFRSWPPAIDGDVVRRAAVALGFGAVVRRRIAGRAEEREREDERESGQCEGANAKHRRVAEQDACRVRISHEIRATPRLPVTSGSENSVVLEAAVERAA